MTQRASTRLNSKGLLVAGTKSMERRETHIELADNLNRLEVAITRGFTESNSAHESTKKEIESLTKSHERISHAVYGNGKEGLITVVAKLQQRVNTFMWVFGTLWIAYVSKIFDFLGHLIK